MDPSNFILKNAQVQSIDLSKNTTKMNLSDVFLEKNYLSQINEYGLFLAHFNCIPNLIHAQFIDCKKANEWFMDAYEKEIKDVYFVKRYFKNLENPEFHDIFYFLYEDLIVFFDTNQEAVKYLFRKTNYSKVESVVNELQKFKIKRRKKTI